MSVKSKVEIIEEVAAYYSEDVTRRGLLKNTACVYYSEELAESGENKVCAVGYCLKDPQSFERLVGGSDLRESNFEVLRFKPEYQVNDLDFWQDLQEFHDGYIYWNDSGLTEKGEKEKDKLKKEYAED